MPSVFSLVPSLGGIAAELGPFDPATFVPSTSFRNVRERRRPIVIGRKGAGKTAIRLAILEEARSNPLLLASDLVFRDYPWNAHNAVFSSEVSSKSRYVETWLFLMLIELGKLVAKHGGRTSSSRECSDVLKSLTEFIQTNWGSIEFDHKDIFRSTEFKVTTGIRPALFGFSAGGVDVTRVPKTRLGDSLNQMNKWLRHAISTVIADDVEYFLVFDNLDLDFDPDSRDLTDSLTGLLLATQLFTAWNSELGTKACLVVLLRDDIFDVLHFQEKNKIFNDLVERIHWNDGWTGPNSLKAVVDSRIRVLLKLSHESEPWSHLFVDPGASYQHLVSRTYLRPRDLIKFVNICLETARARVRGRESDTDRVTRDDRANARGQYSEYLRRELDDEMHAHYPRWEQWLELLRRVEVTNFTQEAFAKVCEQAPELTADFKPAAILEALYQFGVVGFAGRRGSLGQHEYWRYRNPGVAFDHKALYRVHPGLREVLYPGGPRRTAATEDVQDSDLLVPPSGSSTASESIDDPSSKIRTKRRRRRRRKRSVDGGSTGGEPSGG